MASPAKMGFERSMARPRRRDADADPRQLEAALRARAGRRYRFMIFGRPNGPWRHDRREAELDAILAGMATAEEGTGQVYLTVPAWISEKPTGQE